jgi:hypothetical protein
MFYDRLFPSSQCDRLNPEYPKQRSNTLGVKARDAINRRFYNNQSFVETAIYRVFVI